MRPQGDTAEDIQRAIDRLRRRGGGVLECEPGGTYLCDEPIVLDDLRHVTIDGARSEWVYTGTGDFVRMRSAVQCKVVDLRIRATNPANAGHLISTGWSGLQRDPSHLTFDDCEFVSDGPARAGLRLDRAIFVTVRHCQFQGSHFGIVGQDGSYSNVVNIIDGCAFYSLRTAGIFNAGEAWRIEANGFEPLTNGAACAYSQDIATVAKGLTFRGNWCGDITTPGGAWIAARASGLVVDGNYFGSPGGPTDPCLRLFACNGVAIGGNHNQTSSVFVEFAPEAGLSYGVTLASNDLGIGAVRNPQYCAGLRLVNNVGQVDM